MITVFATGRHLRRMPISYPALRPLFADALRVTDRPERADLYAFSHVLDIAAAPRAMVEDWRLRRRPVVLLSEEPFWDTIWGGDPLARHIICETAHGALPVVQLNHHTTDLYRFERVPYYLLTDHRIVTAYRPRFARNARISPREWEAALSARAAHTVFMFERRPEAYHDCRWPEAGIFGLCAWRTALAERCDWPGVERLGRSWQGGPSRFALTDWHLEKLMGLSGRAAHMGAVENTHQPGYVTEKLFDAFACGAVPLYYAGPGQGVERLGLPEESWLNFWQMTPEAAAERLRDHRPDGAAMAGAQERLAALMADTGAFVAERARLRGALLAALETVLDSARAA